MRDECHEDLVDDVKDVCGDDLRSIIHLHEDGRDVVFAREDVERTEERVGHAFETLMFDLLGVEMDEGRYDHGELLCVTRRFERAVELHFPLSETEGVALALDEPPHRGDDVIPTLYRLFDDAL